MRIDCLTAAVSIEWSYSGFTPKVSYVVSFGVWTRSHTKLSLSSVPKKGAVKLPVPTKGSRSSSRSTVKQNDSVHSTPRSQQSTPKQSASAGKGGSKGSGKKATPVSNGRPPPRAGVRSSSRLSHEILATNGPTSKTSSPAAAQAESKKRPATGRSWASGVWTPASKYRHFKLISLGFNSSHFIPSLTFFTVVAFYCCFFYTLSSSAEVSPKAKVVLTPSSTPSSSSSSSSRRSSGRNLGVHELSACEQLTVELVRHEASWPFKKLVSRTQVKHTAPSLRFF